MITEKISLRSKVSENSQEFQNYHSGKIILFPGKIDINPVMLECSTEMLENSTGKINSVTGKKILSPN